VQLTAEEIAARQDARAQKNRGRVKEAPKDAKEKEGESEQSLRSRAAVSCTPRDQSS
jgi:hypothetical protein